MKNVRGETPDAEVEARRGIVVEGVRAFCRNARGFAGVEDEGGEGAVCNARTRLPALSVHGVEIGYSSPGAGAALPPAVSGRVSARAEPDKSVSDVKAPMTTAIEGRFRELRSRTS